jgi:hypothetical protein
MCVGVDADRVWGWAQLGGGGEDVERGQRVELETGDPRVVVERGEARSGGRRKVPVLVPILVVLAVLCAGAVLGFRWYDKATQLERENPTEVLEQYLVARFNAPEPSRVKLFTCRDPHLHDIETILDELARRELDSEVDIEVGISDFAIEINGKLASMRTELRISYRTAANLYRESQSWKFDFVDQDGWRLCEAKQT